MIKRKVSFAMLACLMVVMIVLMALPMGASAAITVVKWSVPVFQGTDSFYATGVVAFEAGTTAQVTVKVYNDQPVDVTIREARIVLDWGADIAATVAPATLRVAETGTFTFDVPVPADATNAVLHNYRVIVGYQRQDTNYVTNRRAGEFIAWGDGATTAFYTDFSPFLASSLKVYWQNSTVTPNTITPQDPSTYVATPLAGRITFGTAPAAGVGVWVDYDYFQSLGSGNGVKTVFFTGSAPVASGTLKVYRGNATTAEWAELTGWTADLETGKITLTSAPSSFETVYATFESWTRWAVVSATDLAVYTADQADAVAAKATYTNINNNYPAYLFTPGTAAAKAAEEARVAKADADAEYANGDFAGAKADYEAAITSLQAAMTADNTLNTATETALLQMLSGADSVVNAYAAKLNAEAKMADGQASMYKNVGVFTILLGVATLLAGLGGILWAYSRLVAAKGPKQQPL